MKFLIGIFSGEPIRNFIPNYWESEIVNQPSSSPNVRAILFSPKEFFTWVEIRQEKGKLRKKKVYKVKVVIQNSAIKGYREFHGRPHKGLETVILSTFIFLLRRIILKCPYIRLNVHSLLFLYIIYYSTYCLLCYTLFTRTSLIAIVKSFVKPHLDYGDIIYDQAYNTSFHQNIESIQCNAALRITGAVRGTFREKHYRELGFESLQQRRWYRKLCCLFKIINRQSPSYLFQLVSSRNNKYFA